jgi:Uncharacterized conserved protein
MWEENVLNNIVRLSEIGTTFASFSVAGVLKRGLKQHGISISRPRGFGHKREMLKAIWNPVEENKDSETALEQEITQKKTEPDLESPTRPRQIAVIGAGIAGLSTAWALLSVVIKSRFTTSQRRFQAVPAIPLPCSILNCVQLSKVLNI